MNVSSCSSSVAPPKTTMIASESQWTVDTLPLLPAEPGDLHDRRDDGHRRGDVDALPLERNEEKQQREIVGEKLHNLLV